MYVREVSVPVKNRVYIHTKASLLHEADLLLDSYANLTHFTYTVLTHFLWGSFRSCNLSIHLLNLKRSHVTGVA